MLLFSKNLRLLRVMSLIFVFITCLNLFAQEPGVTTIRSRTYAWKEVSSKIKNLIMKDKKVKVMHSYLLKYGFSPKSTDKNFYGYTESYRNNTTKDTVQYTLVFQDYQLPGSNDPAALGVMTTAGTFEGKFYTQSYVFYLQAEDGDPEKMKEYYVDNAMAVVPANSWWTCTKNRVKNKCASECLQGFITCVPSAATGGIVSYIACVAANCAGCLIKAGACCGCDCSLWCRWGIGCCEM